MGYTSLNYFDVLFRRAVCVSVHCTHWEQCIQRAFHSDLKPARQLSTCNQWVGIPYRRHFRKQTHRTNWSVLWNHESELEGHDCLLYCIKCSFHLSHINDIAVNWVEVADPWCIKSALDGFKTVWCVGLGDECEEVFLQAFLLRRKHMTQCISLVHADTLPGTPYLVIQSMYWHLNCQARLLAGKDLWQLL